MDIVLILGPPAVGKMAVGLALRERSGWPLLHNHVVADMLAPYFPFRGPDHTELTAEFTRLICPAPTPIVRLSRAYTMAFDFTNFATCHANSRSRSSASVG